MTADVDVARVEHNRVRQPEKYITFGPNVPDRLGAYAKFGQPRTGLARAFLSKIDFRNESPLDM